MRESDKNGKKNEEANKGLKGEKFGKERFKTFTALNWISCTIYSACMIIN